MKKTVLITGCSSGFGKLTAKKFATEGWNVIATMRSPEKEQELTTIENVFVTKLDVTDKESIQKSIEIAIEKFKRIDVLVNNAGYGGHAMLEQFTEKQIYSMFDTNVFGVIRACQAVLPYMRKQKSGTIINVTSMAGHIGLSLGSTYSASKYAVEGLSEAMALEYKPFNINVKSVAPGAFETKFSVSTDNSINNGDNELKVYSQKVAAHFSILAKEMQKQGGEEADPQEVADKIYECATTKTPVHNIVGADAEMLMNMKKSMSHQDFIDEMGKMLTPQE